MDFKTEIHEESKHTAPRGEKPRKYKVETASLEMEGNIAMRTGSDESVAISLIGRHGEGKRDIIELKYTKENFVQALFSRNTPCQVTITSIEEMGEADG